ncbi:MAG: hypothetical protein AUI36_04380 [Cyanobacteria bacterium 13_1_40CM_2_61_4]|nr:MAG: hypothetical protein AUI36_04380 [Cyanobacteria bacterium 13_1_40CM_2_61_4]
MSDRCAVAPVAVLMTSTPGLEDPGPARSHHLLQEPWALPYMSSGEGRGVGKREARPESEQAEPR